MTVSISTLASFLSNLFAVCCRKLSRNKRRIELDGASIESNAKFRKHNADGGHEMIDATVESSGKRDPMLP